MLRCNESQKYGGFGTEKLKRLMLYTFADMKDADIIITDDAIPEEFIKATEKAGVALL